MRLHEIETTIVHPQPPENFAAYFGANPVWTDPSDHRLTVRKAATDMIVRFGAFVNQQIVACIALHEIEGMWQVGFTTTAEHMRQKGLMRLLFNYARKDLGKPICSDVTQTDEAKRMWQEFIQRPKGLTIAVLYPDGSKVPASSVPVEEIWNESPTPLLLIESRSRPPELDYLVVPVPEWKPHHRDWWLDQPPLDGAS